MPAKSDMRITQLPEDALLHIFDIFLKSSNKRTNDNYRFFFMANHNSDLSYRKMTMRCGKPEVLLFRLVCRRFRGIANKRPIVCDLLLNNGDTKFIKRKMQNYPYMPSLPASYCLSSESYWREQKEKNPEILDPHLLANYWKQEVKIDFRLLGSEFSKLIKLNAHNLKNTISELHVGSGYSRAINLWKDTAQTFIESLQCKSVHIGALRIQASDSMPLLRSTKTLASLPELMNLAVLSCKKLVYVLESTYMGDGSDLRVRVPRHKNVPILTSGINGIQYNNRRSVYCDNWKFAGLPDERWAPKNYANIRAAEKLFLQYIFIENIERFLEFFPLLRVVVLFKGCHLKPRTAGNRAKLSSMTEWLVNAFKARKIRVEHYEDRTVCVN